MSNLVKETFGMAVLDLAYSWTVATDIWFKFFYDTQDRTLVQKKNLSLTGIFFFNGVEVKSTKTVKFFHEYRCHIAYFEADIVKK